jgi:hypothetical protein
MSQTFSEVSRTSKLIKKLIENANRFLKIVTFRFTSEDFAKMLITKAKTGVDVEVITTPADNIAGEDMRVRVQKMYEELKQKGVRLLLCPWEVGEPRLTPTSLSGRLAAGIGEKWYSLHLQLLASEKQALVTSQNLVPEENLEVYYLSSDHEFLKQALEKIDTIKGLFFTPVKVDDKTLQGKVIRFLDKTMLQDTLDFLDDSGRLNVKHFWLKQFPQANLKKGIFICPFEGRLRQFLYRFIDSAEVFLYFFVETFFDEDLIRKLEERIDASKEIKIRVITSPVERIRQAPQKARNMIKQLLSLGIDVGYLPNIQGKFWVSDKWLAIPSGDFNKMNLGHGRGKNYWRADAQLLLLDDNEEQIKLWKNMFEQYFEPLDIGTIYKKDVDSLFRRLTKRHKIVSSAEAKNYIARLKSSLIIKTEKDVKYVINLAISLTKLHKKKKVEGIFVAMAIVLYYLQRREHKLDEIVEKLENIADRHKVTEAVSRLQFLNFILKSEDIYRVNVEKILHVK